MTVLPELSGHGLRVGLPPRWEGRLYRRGGDDPAQAGVTNPVLHLGNFALPASRGDFGTGAVERMAAQHVFVALLEYGPDELGSALFAARGLPRLTVADFAANQLQRTLAGQLGCQRFFTYHARAFCLYVVLGSRRHARSLVQQVHEVLSGLDVHPAGSEQIA